MEPQDHILRKLDFIYGEVEGLYSPCDMGHPGIDPVSLFKLVFIQYLFGIRSMWQTIKEINVSVACRRFIVYSLLEPVPHCSAFSKNYSRRFQGTAVFGYIFRRITTNTMTAACARVTMQVALAFACMNLKKLAIWKWRKGKLHLAVAYFYGGHEKLFNFSAFMECKQTNAPFLVDKKRCICLQSEASAVRRLFVKTRA